MLSLLKYISALGTGLPCTAEVDNMKIMNWNKQRGEFLTLGETGINVKEL